MKAITNRETFRQFIHIFFGTLGALNIQFEFIPYSVVVIGFITGYFLFLVINYFSPVFTKKIPVIRNLERENSKIGQGPLILYTAYFVLHTLTKFNIEWKNNASAAMMIVGWGDAATNIFGRMLADAPKLPYNRKKNIAGLFFGILLAAVSASFLVSIPEAILAATLGIFFESLDLKIGNERIDDNITIPIIAFLTLII